MPDAPTVTAEKITTKKGVLWPVKLFVVFHALYILAWSTPTLSPERLQRIQEKSGIQKLLNPIDAWQLSANEIRHPKSELMKDLKPYTYGLATGAWQSWDMFAPNPANTDMWIDATVQYQDGSVETYAYPRMKKLSLTEKYVKERYRKYTERLSGDEFSYKWPHTAYWVAGQMDKYPDNPPVFVTLRRHWRIIEPPDKVTPEEYLSHDFYQAAIDYVRLRRDYR